MKKIKTIIEKYWFLAIIILIGGWMFYIQQSIIPCASLSEQPGTNPALASCVPSDYVDPLSFILICWLTVAALLTHFVSAIKYRLHRMFDIPSDIMISLFSLVGLGVSIIFHHFWLAYLIILISHINQLSRINLVRHHFKFNSSARKVKILKGWGWLVAIYSLIVLCLAGWSWYSSSDPSRAVDVLIVNLLGSIAIVVPTASWLIYRRAEQLHISAKHPSAWANLLSCDLQSLHVPENTKSLDNLVVSNISTYNNFPIQILLEIIGAACPYVPDDPRYQVISQYIKDHHIDVAPIDNVRQGNGGLFGTVQDRTVLLGSYDFLNNSRITDLPKSSHPNRLLLAVEGGYLGHIDLTNPQTEKAFALIKNLGLFGSPKKIAKLRHYMIRIIRSTRRSAWIAFAGATILSIAAALGWLPAFIGAICGLALNIIITISLLDMYKV